MNWVEGIGIVGTVAILVSMCFKTSSFKQTLLLRILNLAGSILFVVYGALLPALSTAILNGALILVNGFHIFLLFKDRKKENTPQKQDDNSSEKTAE